MATPTFRNDGLFDININPQDLADTDPDGLIVTAEDFNGNPFDGGGINTFDPDDFAREGILNGFTRFSLRASAPRLNAVSISAAASTASVAQQGIAVGQGVTWVESGVVMAGVVSAITENTFTVMQFVGSDIPVVAADAPIQTFSPFETLILEQGGIVEVFGPTGCGNNNIPGTGSVGAITTGNNPVGLGPGNNSFTATPSIRIPININGGFGNDILIGGSGPIILKGGPGNDELKVGGQPLSAPLPAGATINRFTLTNWPGAVTLDGAAGNDLLTLTMRGGSITTVDELTLDTNVLDVTGTVNLGGSQLIATVGFSSVPGNTFTIIDNDGVDPIVGTFANRTQGATFVVNGFTLQISYRGGTGNDVVLTHLSNSAPAFQNRTVTPTISEGGIVTITGLITEPDASDLFTLVVDWGDGNAPEEFQFDPARGRDVAVQHRFLDDPNGQGSNERIISLLWRDQHGASNTGQLVTSIQNVVPFVVARPKIDTNAGALFKGQGQFTDSGTDSWFATVDYGDGQGEKALPLGPNATFSLEYQYVRADRYTVKVRVTDDDGGTGESAFPVRVESEANGELFLLFWRNRRLNVDVNEDGDVNPLDVLLVINELNRGNSPDLLQRLSELDINQPLFVDSDGDGYLTPLDALIVINYLNTRSNEANGEGEGGNLGSIPNMELAMSIPNIIPASQPPSLSPAVRTDGDYGSLHSVRSVAAESTERTLGTASDYQYPFDIPTFWKSFDLAIMNDLDEQDLELDELLEEISMDIHAAIRNPFGDNQQSTRPGYKRFPV